MSTSFIKKKYLYFLCSWFLGTSFLFGSVQDLKKHPHTLPKVVSLSIASDEILFELYASSKQLHRILAYSKLVDDPRYSNIAQQKAVLANRERYAGSLEHLLNLAPELVVLADFNQPELIHNLKKSKTPIHEIKSSSTLAEIIELIKNLGNRIGARKESSILTARLKKRLARIQANAKSLKKKPQVLFLLPDGTSAGEDTLIHDLIVQAGGQNISSSFNLKGWPHISTEQLLRIQSDIVLTRGKVQNFDAEYFKNHPIYKNLKAVQKNQILFVDEAKLFAMSQFSFDACEEIQKKFLAWSQKKDHSNKNHLKKSAIELAK